MEFLNENINENQNENLNPNIYHNLNLNQNENLNQKLNRTLNQTLNQKLIKPQEALPIQIMRVDPNNHEHVDDLIHRITTIIHKNPTRTFCPEISACIRTNNRNILSHIVKETTIDCPDSLFYEFIASDIYRSGKGFSIASRWFGANAVNHANKFDVRTLTNHIPKILYPLSTRNNPNLKQTIFQIKIANTVMGDAYHNKVDNTYKVDDAYKFIQQIIHFLHNSSSPFPKAIFQWLVDELTLAGPSADILLQSEVKKSTATIADLIIKCSEKIILNIITNPHLIRSEDSKYCLLIRKYPNFHKRINRILQTHGFYEDVETTLCYPEASATIETNHYPTKEVLGYPERYVPTRNTVLPKYLTSTTYLSPQHSPSFATTDMLSPPPQAIPMDTLAKVPYAIAEPEVIPNEFRVSDPNDPGIRLIRNKEQTRGGRRRPLRRTKKNTKGTQKRKQKLSRKTRSRNHR